MTIRQDHDKEHDIMALHWGDDGTEVSEEITSLEGHDFVIDYDKLGRIVGIEIFEWSKGGTNETKNAKE